MRKPSYAVLHVGDNYVLLQDIGPWDRFPTITNGAEVVVEEMFETGFGEKRLFYYDSDNDLTELTHNYEGRFLDFRFPNHKEQADLRTRERIV